MFEGVFEGLKALREYLEGLLPESFVSYLFTYLYGFGVAFAIKQSLSTVTTSSHGCQKCMANPLSKEKALFLGMLQVEIPFIFPIIFHARMCLQECCAASMAAGQGGCGFGCLTQA